MNIQFSYKKWSINQRLRELQLARKHWPNSPQDDRRLREIDLLQEELKSIDEK